MAHPMKPDHHDAVEKERPRRSPLDGLGHAVGLFPETHELLAVLKSAFDRPATGVGREDLSRVPVELGAVEHLVGPSALEVADQNDRQQAVAARLVVQSLDGLDGESGMKTELLEIQFGPG